jgi:hypothetical protein
MRSVSILVVAAVAALFVTVVAPTGAIAAQFHTSATSASLKGTQASENVFTVQGEKVSCKSMTWAGTSPAGETTFSSMEFTPTYAECTAFGFSGSLVEMDGCKYKTKANSTVDLVCPSGHKMTIMVSVPFIATCSVDVPPQTNLVNLNYVNNGAQSIISLVMFLSNVDYEVTQSTGLCPLSVASATNGSYSGQVSLTANGGATKLWWE